ncbi:MAG: hypothetical protein HC876_14620 [Chloroflexaceae bacterium]|nr:hypothetical protein [Chloroflexaceae bacterium]NJO06648.1 hypothetical protein [Chloroflexaceae bacterium]
MAPSPAPAAPRHLIAPLYIAIIASPIVIILLMVTVNVMLFAPAGFSNVAEMASKRGVVLVLRLPAQPDAPPEQIVVLSDNQYAPVPRQALRGPVGGDIEGMNGIQLSELQWQDLADFRAAWCSTHILNPPTRATANEPFYDLGVRCQRFNGRRFTVPADALPPELVRLIETVEAGG